MQQQGTISIQNKKLNEIRQAIKKASQNPNKNLVQLKITKSLLHQDKDGKLKILLNYMENLNLKPTQKKSQSKNPFLDPIQTGLLICQLEQKHRLLFNKFNIFENHLLVVTKNFEKQLQKLNFNDICEALFAAAALKGLFFFNGGLLTGASQPHKHIQILPQEARELPIFKQIIQYSHSIEPSKQILSWSNFAFQHAIIKIKGDSEIRTQAKQMLDGYEKIYNKYFKNLNIQDINYNLIGCESFLLLVPRKKENAFDKLSINSVGFLGSLLFKNEQTMKWFLSQTQPSKILEDITFQKQ